MRTNETEFETIQEKVMTYDDINNEQPEIFYKKLQKQCALITKTMCTKYKNNVH